MQHVLIYHRLVFSEHGRFKLEALSASSRPGSLRWAAAPIAEMAERAAAPVLKLVARIPWRPSIARQTEKKCFHMPYNLQTATTKTSSAFFYPFPLGIQIQLFSEVTSSGSLEMWPSRAKKLAGH